MRILLIVFAFFAPLLASNLLTYNIYERSDRIDVMLSFDAPYEGNIFQKRENDMTMLIFNGLNFDQAVDKSLNSKILQELYIEPKQNNLILSIKSSSEINVNASKTSDGFGLRVRVTSAAAPPKEQPIIAQEIQTRPQSTPITTADDTQSFLDTRYYIVVGFLLAIAIALWAFKNFIVKKGAANKKFKFNGWFVKDGDQNVEILYERPLDKANKVMLLSHQNKKYLVLVGSSNVLLDKFGEDRIENEEDFQAFFEENRKKLGQYLEERQNSLSAYKDKASVS